MPCPQLEHILQSWDTVGFSSVLVEGRREKDAYSFLTTFQIGASLPRDVRVSKDLQDNSIQSPYFIDEKTASQRLRLNDFSVHK